MAGIVLPSAAAVAAAKAALAQYEQQTGAGSPAAMWKDFGEGQGAIAKAAKAKAGPRPAPNAEPLAVKAWLDKSGLSPVFAYPEWPWTFSGDTATTQHFIIAPDDGVTWTANDHGQWSYVHSYGGTDLGQLLNSFSSALAIGADLAGFAFAGMFLHVAQAVVNHEPLASLGQALKADWDRTSNAGQLAFSLLDGDWQQAWDQATKYGTDLSGIVAAFYPGKAPDRSGNLTVTAATKPPAESASKTTTPPPTPKKPAMNLMIPSFAPGTPLAKIVSQTVGLSPPPSAAATTLAVPGAVPPPAAPQHWWQKTLFTLPTAKKTPVTVGEVGGLGALGLGVAKFMGYL